VLTGSSQTEEALELWRQKVRPKLHSFPRTRAGLAQNLKPGILTHPVLGRFPVPILLIEAKRIEVSIRKMVWGLHWFHTGKIMPKRESFGLQMLNTAQVANYFNDPENERIFKATKPGIYRDPAVVRTFFYTCATSASSTLWYFFFYRQNIAIAYTGELADLVDEPSNPPLNVTSPQDAPAG
jgi:hypothetical protein